MKVISRNIKKAIEKDLKQKFVFLSGSRQVGKTTLAREIIGEKMAHSWVASWVAGHP